MSKITKNFQSYLLPISLILILSFSRLIPHPWNFTPVLAMGIFSGYYFKQFYLGLFIVIVSMFLGDLYLGFHSTMFFTYISLAVAVICTHSVLALFKIEFFCLVLNKPMLNPRSKLFKYVS